MKITNQIHRQSCGTHYYTLEGEGFTKEELEKKFASDAPFGMTIRINPEGTYATVDCYYD